MAPDVKVTYFAIRALGEPIRFLLKYGGVDFEDVRIEFEDWPTLKPSTPFGQIPLYEEDGKTVNQSVAVCRYLGKKFELAGNDDWENLEVDAVVDTLVDLRLKIREYGLEKDPETKEKLKEPLFGETLPFYLERLERIAKDNNGHLALGKLTWADLYFASTLDVVNYLAGKDVAEGHPNLKSVQDHVYALPAIGEWVQNRPESNL